jgi:hypothetical protein
MSSWSLRKARKKQAFPTTMPEAHRAELRAQGFSEPQIDAKDELTSLVIKYLATPETTDAIFTSLATMISYIIETKFKPENRTQAYDLVIEGFEKLEREGKTLVTDAIAESFLDEQSPTTTSKGKAN